MEKRESNHNCPYHLHQCCQRLKTAEHLAKLGYWELDLISRKFYCSDEMLRMLGESDKKNTRRILIRNHIYRDDLPFYKKQIKNLTLCKEAVSGQIRLIRNDKQIIYTKFSATMLSTNLIGGTFQDISEEVRAQQALEHVLKQTEAAFKNKNDFIAQASHDLRQPLQAIMLFASALQDELTVFRHRQIADKLLASALGLNNLLNHLLDISKFDGGVHQVDKSHFNLQDMLNAICSELRQNQEINVICRSQPANIYTDYILLERIVRNLLSNAIKYNRGKILISCHQMHQKVVIRIIDNGCGIKKSEQQKVFKEFYQSSEIENNRNLGAGLGLSIVNRIAKILNIKIKLRSNFGYYTAVEIGI